MSSASSPHYVIAIDGVSGSGKSSTAKQVARELGILHLDTGAMYRVVTWFALQKGLRASQAAEITALAAALHLDVNDAGNLLVEGREVGSEIRGPEVSAAVSDFSGIPGVREVLVGVQRRIGAYRSLVAEGRDIGTVVFPNARFKFFMSASPEVRAMRRTKELLALGQTADHGQVLGNLNERDAKDSGRAHSPLLKASDAVEIDTSGLTIPQQVAIITNLVLKNAP